MLSYLQNKLESNGVYLHTWFSWKCSGKTRLSKGRFRSLLTRLYKLSAVSGLMTLKMFGPPKISKNTVQGNMLKRYYLYVRQYGFFSLFLLLPFVFPTSGTLYFSNNSFNAGGRIDSKIWLLPLSNPINISFISCDLSKVLYYFTLKIISFILL